ncbi:hypothetical protein [Chromobacterium sp. Beijing]|uniref:hypothetical protein n=1 Tax=Chromobacterium sp. Beijing TaxID=2735795 RepID=UPI001F458CA7|nr:hypothetical protein [Chromobacterium sp. Beijing]UJB31012.1 hypothetical protein HQN78_08030 [Chromobacterium sp. Beijing]
MGTRLLARDAVEAFGPRLDRLAEQSTPGLRMYAVPEGSSLRPPYLSLSEFADLPRAGMIDPRVVRYSQNNASAYFKPPYGSVDDFIGELKAGRIEPNAIAPIRIVERSGKIFTLDNRRLYGFEQAGINVPYEKLDVVPKRELFKFSTENDGVSISIRRGK